MRLCHGSKTDWVYLLVETLELMMTALSETPPPAGNIHAETDGERRDTERSSEKGEEREKKIFK